MAHSGLKLLTLLLGWGTPGPLLQHCYTTAVMKKIQLQKLFAGRSAPVHIGGMQSAMARGSWLAQSEQISPGGTRCSSSRGISRT